MRITYDPAKDISNQAKHGLSLTWAAQLEWDSAQVWLDQRQNYGEPRQCALVMQGERLYFVAFVDRAEARRVISLRRANVREVKDYAAND
jgi:uncharacterized protein